jgi:hypothetical protein
MLIASRVVMFVLGSVVVLGVVGYLIDKNADGERD